MKLTKLISIVSAVAMSLSMVTVANADAPKPSVTAEFVEYTTNSAKSWAKAWVKVTIDTTAVQELSAYTEGTAYDEEEEDDVIVKKGNGITTLGGQIKIDDAAFAAQATNTSYPSTWVLEAKSDYYKVAFGPKNVASEYYTEGKTELLLNFKITSANFDKAANISLSDITIDGTKVDVYHTTNNTSTWGYSQATNTIAIAGCAIPSYTDWSTPDEPVVDDVWTSDEVPSIEAGKKVVAHSENVTVTADSRVSITVDGTTKLFGETISAYLAKKDIILDGEATANVRFALLVDEAANNITFNVQ